MRGSMTVIMGLLVAACGQVGTHAGDATGNGTAAATSGQAVTVGGGWKAEDACSLLSDRTVAGALGTDITGSELGTVVPRTDQTAGFSTCFYNLKDGQQAAFMARQSPDPDNTPEAMQRARAEIVGMIGPVEDVTGVGKSAFWIPKLRQLVVFLGDDRYYNLTMPAKVGAKDPKALALALASRID